MATRHQQVYAALLGLAVALGVKSVGYETYFARGYLPPPAQVLAAALELSGSLAEVGFVLPWLLAGALAQWLGGPGRQVGLLLATGLLIDQPSAGWALLAGLAGRALLSPALRGRADSHLATFGLGCITGEMARSLSGGL